MRAAGALGAALLLVCTANVLQVSAEDLYWEGEEDASNEFLEVKVENLGIGSHLRRLKRGLFDFFGTSDDTPTTTAKPDPYDEQSIDEEVPDEKDEDLDNDGSGLPERERESEPREKTLRVSFVVNQPYQTEYSNRDSMQFQTFSRSLADEVNLLFETLPGTQRASLVRIQSRITDEFTCKVTLDIVTSGYDDTQRITDILQEHIRNRRTLGSIVVSDADFNANVIDPGYNSTIDACAVDELRCDDGHCVAQTARCNGYNECADGSDEAGCNPDRGDPVATTENVPEVENRPTDATILPEAVPTNWLPWSTHERGDQNGFDENNGDNEIEPTTSQYDRPSATCRDDELKCDETRCVPLIRRCDGAMDCYDGADEAGCESCSPDDFRCDNGKCIAGNRRCDRIVDCPSEEDEQNCVCTSEEFSCVSDGTCIENRKRCDGISHCPDNSDEVDCACGSDQWQCDHGNCIKRSKRCDGRVDCPTDRSDERNCYANGYFRCVSGKIIAESLRCNRRYDCPQGDYSDEQNCPCGEADFQCDNGYCIPASKHCDRTHDCQDGSDERDCTYGTICMAYEYKCSSGQCVRADGLCNGTAECDDGSDEHNCPCKRDEFNCRDGSCINIALRCNGLRDCKPNGEDELNCGSPRCPPDSFTCDSISSILCAKRCDGRVECDGGEDEDNCQECFHECDGRCLDDRQICDQVPDCSDGSDELQCDKCDGPHDFRCRSGECLNVAQQCNGVPECPDYSDERNCNETMIPATHGCLENQFQCRDGACIDRQFFCDNHADCLDTSDEENCPWHVARPSRSPSPPPPCHESEFTCYDGRCIPHMRRCDNIYDCLDFSDEQNCYYSACDSDQWQCVSGQCVPEYAYCDNVQDCTDGSDETDCVTTPPRYTTAYPDPYPQPVSTLRPDYTTTSFPNRPYSTPESFGDRCDRNQWRCENGPCINSNRRCDGHVDCPYDSSDEFDCPAGSPIVLELRTYPDAQTVRNGGDVVFQCRDEGPLRAPVRWVRGGGRPLKPGSTDRNGRLEMIQVSVADSGEYICQAVRYLGYPRSEIRVQLTVDGTPVTQSPAFLACKAYQATCGNGQCISKNAVCDGKIDCSDGSDEDACNQNGMCEPNQYQCANRKCVLKTWLCDSEDDCGDGSDERNCGASDPRQLCLPVEYKCNSNTQCVPKSFHCDGQSDCADGSDEIGCAPVHVTKPPVPANLRLNPGETLTLVCEAVGVPIPLISWRLNWGHVPEKCTSTSKNGVGTLTCPNMQPENSGAYSCEAINNKGTTFAAPDSIVYVNKTDVCPSGFFNSDARSEQECIRCFCFGESTQCRSADLFTYDMPTPLGEGGTRLVGVKQTYSGEIQLDSQPITDQYYYLALRNGATVTKLENYGPRSYGYSDAHPYLTLPETYNGNQLTSYGGHIKYRLSPHLPRYGSEDSLPDIIIKGKYETLIHKHRGDKSRELYVEARLTPENWEKADSSGLSPATREDIMMALDNIEMILLRTDLNNAGVNITDFVMESAQHINVGLGAASLVEECTCPTGHEGLSCQKCASGYTRVKSGPWLGNCVREQRVCPEGTYGDPDSGYGCRPCPCPLTNRGNQFARTCSVGPSGAVVCDCETGYGGQNCEYCEAGYVGNPMIPGDYCKEAPVSKCVSVGTARTIMPDECQCKDNVQGRYCDECKSGSFYLSESFRQGCALCFCTGMSNDCRSSNLRRRTTTVRFNTPQIVNQVSIYSSAPLGPAGSIKYNAPIETDLRPSLIRGEFTLGDLDRSKPTIYYWSLPASYGGDKVTSYGGFLRYTLRHIPIPGGLSARNTAADIQLISENRLTFHYFGNFLPANDGTLNASVQFLEKGWKRPDGKEISRAHFLLALADVKAILIKATYTTNAQLASLDSASIDTAESNGDGPPALHVEQCVCPLGYIGTSCEDCAPGFTRSSSGLYLENCGPCKCNNHSSMCHPETGICYNCRDNTDGVNCELCKPGYVRNDYDICVPDYSSSTQNPCRCDPRGEAEPCDMVGYCSCKLNVEGEYCDRCRPGTFGLDGSNPRGCTSCYCSGVTTDCHEASHYTRIPMAASIFGENYGGYTLTDLNAEQVINDQFVPAPNESELMYMFSFPPTTELYWSLPVFPGTRVLSYGGSLSITQKFESGGYPEISRQGTDVVLVGDTVSIYWRNPNSIRSGEALSYQVPLREDDWFILNSVTPASRNDFMSVLRNLRRVLVRATLAPRISSTAIADVSMDTATESSATDEPVAKGVEICLCPDGFIGTSCESCARGWYKDLSGYCRKCNCNGHDCHLGSYNEVICSCRPPYTGLDCSTVGLIMELHPTIHDDGNPYSLFRKVTLSCKYRAPTPLTIQFYHKGQEVKPSKPFTESQLYSDGWHGEHTWNTVWDTRHQGEIFECHTVTERGFTLGVLSTSLPEPGGESNTANRTTRPPPVEPTVFVRITSPTIKIQEIGSSVNFTCQAQSRMTQSRPPVTWTKVDGYLPQGRSQVDSRTGLLLITNLQQSDSGQYICQTNDGISTAQAIATLKVPVNEITEPGVTIRPAVNDYFEGDRIQLECIATGNPAPRITWQRASNRPLPLSSESFDELFIIESAREEDSGEYRCIASNAAGSTDRTAIVSVRPKPSVPSRNRLTVSSSTPTVNEGQSTRVVCTGTTNVPAGTIDWIRQDRAVFLSNVRSDNGVLYIDFARPENQGVYICQTANSEVDPVPVLVSIIPLGPISPSQSPNITVNVDHVTIPTGGTGSVDCNPTGYPLPLVRWKKYQNEFGPSTSQRDNTLIINNAQEDDQGYYLCEGTVNGTPVANIYVYVEIEKRVPPRVEIRPQGEQSVTLGSQFEYNCRVLEGVPEPDVTWDRNGGRPLSPYAQLRPNNVLRFERIEVNDEGEYTCSATNIAGTSSASAILKVRSPPEIFITPSSYVQAVHGDSVTIECRANGYPEPMVSISTRQDRRVIVPPSPGIAVLRIPSVSDRDEADYVCTATSSADTINDQFVIRVDRGDGGFGDGGGSGEGEFNPYPYPDYPNENQPTNLIAFEGEDRRIECNASDEFEVEWRRIDRPLQSNAVQRGATLVIYNATKSDSGQYECTVINRYTQEVQQAAYTSLQVVPALRITLRPKTQTVYPGQSPTVECIVDGDDIIDVTWRPVDVTRPLSRRVEIRQSSLIFHQIEVEDAGQYECFARNRYANASSSAEVVVVEETGRETWESHENEQYAHQGAAVHLSCNVTQPNLRIRWIKNGRNVPSSVRQKKDGSLMIRLAQKSDSGRYVCIIEDEYGRKTSNYINLHIEGIECLDTQFRCYDNSDCIEEDRRCDGYYDCQDYSDEENCLLRDKRLSETLLEYNSSLYGPPAEALSLVSIDQPRRQYRVGDNVEVLCRAGSREIQVSWERYGNNQQRQFVEERTYGDGSMLVVRGVEESDAGVYRCTGRDPYGRTSYEDFNLEVTPVSVGPANPLEQDVYMARLGTMVDLPCNHNLEQPVMIEWRKEYSSLPPDARTNEPNLHLEQVTEADAGTYVCRVSNNRVAVEARAILRVEGVVPRFDGDSWITLPTLRDAYRQFDIEISFKPSDANGLILYNSQNQGRSGDYLALHLVDLVPQFVLDAGTGPIIVRGDRPLQLNTWHTIRLSRTNSKVTMDVDNTGPFITESSDQWEILDLAQPLYVGGVPDYSQLPSQLAGTSGFFGCVSMLILGREEKNVIVDSIEQYNVKECDSCTPNLCLNKGVCQEARNERGYMCLCTAGFAGLNCDRTGEACHPGLCGPGKCTDTADGYKCSCPVTYTGRNCDVKQSIEYPAFTGSAYLAIKAPKTSRYFRMSMKIKAASPVTDGIIMYCAESARGYGGFTSLAVHDGRLEFRYDLGDGSSPVVLTANRTLPANEWTDVHIARIVAVVSLKINLIYAFEQKLESPKRDLYLETPMFVGGVDDSIVLNNNTGVIGGFNGCIKDVMVYGENVDIVNSSIQSANVQECSNYDRGDIPEYDSPCALCRNGGYCSSAEATACTCPPGYTGLYCESRAPSRRPYSDPCAALPCRNGGSCRPDRATRMNYTCDCPLGYAGANCQMPLELLQSVGFNGNGYLELPAELLRYDNLESEPVVVALAFHTVSDGVLLYQREALAAPNLGDYILLRVENGHLVLDWDLGGGLSSLTVDDIYVNDGERHAVIAKLHPDFAVSLSVDRDHYKSGVTNGLSSLMNADSNVYIGGIPDHYNVNSYPGLTGCIEQVELMDSNRGLTLGRVAVTGRNAQRCKDSMFPDVYPFFEEIEVFESPPPRHHFNSNPRPAPSLGLHSTLVLYCLCLFQPRSFIELVDC